MDHISTNIVAIQNDDLANHRPGTQTAHLGVFLHVVFIYRARYVDSLHGTGALKAFF